MKVDIRVIHAFIDGSTGGNPAGVLLDADNLNHEQKLAIAKKVGLSETAFVSASSSADFKLDFYTPTRQIAHCGHATIAVFNYLALTGRIGQGWTSKETIDGNRKILVKDGMAYMEQSPPVYKSVTKFHQQIINSIGVNEQQLINSPKLVNTGNSFLVLGVENRQFLSQLKPDFEDIKSVSEELDLIGYYIFTRDTSKSGRDASTRMFAPRYGINEESATGMAAGPLACYLYDEIKVHTTSFTIEQGYFMQTPSPSVIYVNLEFKGSDIASLMAGGVARLSDEFSIEID